MSFDDATKKVYLASGFTVGHYLDALARQDREGIAEAIHRRFTERYVEPATAPGGKTHGFTIMAVACLMVEALESFRRGWPDTSQRGQSEHAFCSFFDGNPQFGAFQGYAREFYKGVRCGILHQAETGVGWRVRRTGDLLRVDGGTRTINGRKFMQALSGALDHYRDDLTIAGWDDELWRHLRTKMKRVCANCASQP